MKFETFNEITERFVKSNLMPQTTNPSTRFIMGMALGAGTLRAETMVPQLEAFGIVTHDADGRPDGIDTEKLANALLAGFDAVPEIAFERYGLTLRFKKSDAETYLAALGAG